MALQPLGAHDPAAGDALAIDGLSKAEVNPLTRPRRWFEAVEFVIRAWTDGFNPVACSNRSGLSLPPGRNALLCPAHGASLDHLTHTRLPPVNPERVRLHSRVCNPPDHASYDRLTEIRIYR